MNIAFRIPWLRCLNLKFESVSTWSLNISSTWLLTYSQIWMLNLSLTWCLGVSSTWTTNILKHGSIWFLKSSPTRISKTPPAWIVCLCRQLAFWTARQFLTWKQTLQLEVWRGGRWWRRGGRGGRAGLDSCGSQAKIWKRKGSDVRKTRSSRHFPRQFYTFRFEQSCVLLPPTTPHKTAHVFMCRPSMRKITRL